MGTMQVLDEARMLEIESESIVDGHIDGSGHLILTTHGGDNIDTGDISHFVPSRLQATNNLGSGNDPNDLTDTGWYSGYGWVGSLAGYSIGVLEVMKYSPDWIIQIFRIPQANPRMFVRARYSGTTWTAWLEKEALATTSFQGEVILATDALATAGVGPGSTTTAVTPSGVKAALTDFVDKRFLTGVIDSHWSSGLPNVTLSDSRVVQAYLPPQDIDIQPGSSVVLHQVNDDLWMIDSAFSSQPKFMKQIALGMNGVSLYSRPGDAEYSQMYGDFIPEATGGGRIYATRSSTGIVHVNAMLMLPGTALASGTIISQLPTSWAPARTQVWEALSSGGLWGAVAVTPDGAIRYVGAGAPTSNYFTLNNIRFRTADSGYTFVPLTLKTGFAEQTAQLFTGEPSAYYGSTGKHTPGYTMDEEGVVLFEGAVVTTTSTSVNQVIAQCTALTTLAGSHQQVWCANQQMAVRYGSDSSGGPGPTNNLNTPNALASGYFFTISQVCVVMPSGQSGVTAPLTFWDPDAMNSWAQYGSGWAAPAFAKTRDGNVFARGLWRSGSVASAMTWLPKDYLPRYDIWLSTVSNLALAVMAVGAWYSNGGVLRQNAVVPVTGSNTWYSFDGCSWPAYR